MRLLFALIRQSLARCGNRGWRGQIAGLPFPTLHEKIRPPFTQAFAILLAVALGAIPVYAQETSTIEVGKNRAQEENRTIEIPGPGAGSNDQAAEQEDEDGDVPEQSPTTDHQTNFADIDQFSSGDDFYQSPIGALLQCNCAELKSGQTACGLAVLEIHPGSPAAIAGLRPYSGLGHTLLGATVVGASMVFPPAFAAMGLVEHTHFGEAYDLIIGVDGHRIRGFPDFLRAISEVRMGDVLYLTIIRHGARLQIPVRFPDQSAPTH